MSPNCAAGSKFQGAILQSGGSRWPYFFFMQSPQGFMPAFLAAEMEGKSMRVPALSISFTHLQSGSWYSFVSLQPTLQEVKNQFLGKNYNHVFRASGWGGTGVDAAPG